MAHPPRFERGTIRLEGGCSIQLSYGCPDARFVHAGAGLGKSNLRTVASRVSAGSLRRVTVPNSSSAAARADGRRADQLRPLRFQNHIAPHATGSTLIEWGNTRVICAVTVEESVPRWMKDQKVEGGWITAEYSMLPYSTLGRKARDISKLKLDGRTVEIQRLIGRSLRAALDLQKLGARTLWIDCDVLQADGGTRTASITGAGVALGLAIRKLQSEGKLTESPITSPVAAVSVGVVAGQSLLDLNYVEDAAAEVDMNLVMNAAGEFIELQASGEEATFGDQHLADLLRLGKGGIRELISAQQLAIAV